MSHTAQDMFISLQKSLENAPQEIKDSFAHLPAAWEELSEGQKAHFQRRADHLGRIVAAQEEKSK